MPIPSTCRCIFTVNIAHPIHPSSVRARGIFSSRLSLVSGKKAGWRCHDLTRLVQLMPGPRDFSVSIPCRMRQVPTPRQGLSRAPSSRACEEGTTAHPYVRPVVASCVLRPARVPKYTPIGIVFVNVRSRPCRHRASGTLGSTPQPLASPLGSACRGRAYCFSTPLLERPKAGNAE
jgi:hypothetical protein